jgi:hypothetical protein
MLPWCLIASSPLFSSVASHQQKAFTLPSNFATCHQDRIRQLPCLRKAYDRPGRGIHLNSQPCAYCIQGCLIFR